MRDCETLSEHPAARPAAHASSWEYPAFLCAYLALLYALLFLLWRLWLLGGGVFRFSAFGLGAGVDLALALPLGFEGLDFEAAFAFADRPVAFDLAFREGLVALDFALPFGLLGGLGAQLGIISAAARKSPVQASGASPASCSHTDTFRKRSARRN